MNQVTIGNYLAQRLEEVGVRDYFAIPGDFNLSLLDELLKNSRLKMINCCNELNAGYAADGYAREKGVAALVLTIGVGVLSAVNAVVPEPLRKTCPSSSFPGDPMSAPSWKTGLSITLWPNPRKGGSSFCRYTRRSRPTQW